MAPGSASAAPIALNGRDLTIWDVFLVAHKRVPAHVPASCHASMRRSRAFVDQVLAEDRVVYGVTTGFGFMKDKKISPDEVVQLQINLIRSHAAGVGKALPTSAVRAMTLAGAGGRAGKVLMVTEAGVKAGVG